MSDLVKFLHARLDDREADARLRLDSDDQYGQSELDPDVLLAEVDAKRKIIAECVPGRVGGPELDLAHALGEVVLSYLALPYADHEDFDEEWRP